MTWPIVFYKDYGLLKTESNFQFFLISDKMANRITFINHTKKQVLIIEHEEWFEVFTYIREEMPSWLLEDDVILIQNGAFIATLLSEKGYTIRNVSDI